MHLTGWLSLLHLVVFFSGALICSFTWAIFLSQCACFRVRGGALGVHQGGVTHVAALWCCMWGRGGEGNNGTCSTLWGISVTSPTTSSKLGPSGADSRVGGLVCILGPCGSLQETVLWGWEFLPPLPQSPRVFSVWGLRLYFPELETWVASSVSLPSCSSQFIRRWMRGYLLHQPPPHWVHQLRPCSESSPPGCPSPPLLPVWMNVSSLTPWLLDSHTVRLSGSSGWFLFFKFVVVLLLVVRGGTVCLPIPPSWPEVPLLQF